VQSGVPVVVKQLVGRVDNSAHPSIDVNIQFTLTTPAGATGRVPLYVEFSFGRPRGGAPRAGEGGPSWQQQVLERGWGYGTLMPASIQADNGGGLSRGIIGLANRGRPRSPEDWGALRAWAWGASRALDYLETDKAVDAKRVCIGGLSRYGKAALVAMAYDTRFAIALVGSSGAGGAKLLRRDFGERVENLASSGEYHWFAGNFLKYAGALTPADLSVDAHQLIALCAPRPVFISVGSPAVEGTWVDARGMFMAAVAAGPVYRLLGRRDLGTTEMPPIETSLTDGQLAFRQHAGGHTVGPNWPAFLDYAQRHFAPAPSDRPADRNDDPTWVRKHAELVARAKRGDIDVYFAGDSITRRWEATHRDSWDKNFGAWKAADFGAGGDRTEHQHYRLENGELDGVNPKVVVLMIGTNNVGFEPAPGSDKELVEDVVKGVTICVRAVRKRAPKARILLMGITARNSDGSTALMPTTRRINARLAKLADGDTVRFCDINGRLADETGRLHEGMTEDGLHLSDEGYQVWADAIRPTLTEWLDHPPSQNPRQ
jgi:lysophospholipase L1-like esterase